MPDALPSTCARARLDRTRLQADGDGPMRFVASTEDTNRYGFSLRNDGWRLDNYNANPVVLWMHNDFRPPIGQGRALSEGGQIILDDVEFDGEDELARQVESKYRRGFLHAVSVSWDYQGANGTPVAAPWRLSADEIREEMFYDLAEISAVSVPGDPGALRAQQARLALDPYGSAALGLLDDVAGERDHGTATAGELRAALLGLAGRLGIDLTPPPPPAPTREVVPDPPSAEVSRAFLDAFDVLTLHTKEPPTS